MDSDGKFEAVAKLVNESERILFITGAGISTDSGLPTYRGIGGLYEGRDTEDGIPIEEALSHSMMSSSPQVTWKYLWQIAEVSRGSKPNRGHEIIAQWMRKKPGSWILTQNVDGLHVAAFDSENVIEVHGRAENLYCMDCGKTESGEEVLFHSGRVKQPDPPICRECDGMLRPDVVLFGEFLSDKSLDQMSQLQSAGIDLVVSIGTSSLFPYITGPVELAHEFGIPCAEINPEETTVSRLCDYRLKETCTVALEEIAKRIS